MNERPTALMENEEQTGGSWGRKATQREARPTVMAGNTGMSPL